MIGTGKGRRELDLLWARAKPYAAAVVIIGGATLLADLLFDFAHLTRLAGIFLLAVLIVASRSGPRPALFASALAFFAYAYSVVEPRFSFQIDTYQELVNLIAFVVVALVTGQLAGRLRSAFDHSRARAARLAALFDASRALSALAEDNDIRLRLAIELSKAVHGRAEIIWEGRTWVSAVNDEESEVRDWATRELKSGGVHLGVCRWKSGARPLDQRDHRDDLVDVIVELGAGALARARLAGEVARLATDVTHKAPG